MRVALTLTFCVVVALTPAAAFAQEYPVESGTLAVDDATVLPGEPLRIQGSGFEPGGTISVTIESDPVVLGRTTANGAGAIDVTVRIPTQISPGDHVVNATGPAPGGGVLVLSRTVTVVGEESSLPRTGWEAAVLVAVGVAAVAAGAAMRSFRRRPG